MAEELDLETRLAQGRQDYQEWKQGLRADPNYQAIYREEAAKKEMWLQLVEARQQAGLTQVELAERLGISQAQVARIEKRGYDTYKLSTLRRYVDALGPGFDLEVRVARPRSRIPAESAAG